LRACLLFIVPNPLLLSSMATIREGSLYYRNDPKEKWTKVYVHLERESVGCVVRLVPSKAPEDANKTVASFTITKEVLVVGPIHDKERTIFHLVDGSAEMHLSDKHSKTNRMD